MQQFCWLLKTKKSNTTPENCEPHFYTVNCCLRATKSFIFGAASQLGASGGEGGARFSASCYATIGSLCSALLHPPPLLHTKTTPHRSFYFSSRSLFSSSHDIYIYVYHNSHFLPVIVRNATQNLQHLDNVQRRKT